MGVVLSDNATVPTYGTKHAACFDLYASEDAEVKGPMLINTGLRMEIPEGFELQIRPRSGMAKRGVMVLNSPGTVDADYRGEIKVLLCAMDHSVRKGDRIAQGIIVPVWRSEFDVREEISDTERGDGGFGSTGR